VCVLGPFAFAAMMQSQSGSPSDTIFGVWVHTSGFAIPLVVLAFAGAWGFPVLAGVLGGDLFSAEDRYGTWKMILTRSCRRRDLFVGKALAAATFSVGLIALLAVSGLAAGLLFVGDQPLVGLGGTLLAPGTCIALVLAAWLTGVLPMFGFASLAMLLSAATRNGIAGVLGTILVALVMQLLALVGTGTWVHALLLASAFDGVPDRDLGDHSPPRLRRHTDQPPTRMGNPHPRRAADRHPGRRARGRQQLGSPRSHCRSPHIQHRPHLQQPHPARATTGRPHR
jgi:ABC-2 type transport system permease protein